MRSLRSRPALADGEVTPRVDGSEPSNDPLLELRAAIYLLSGRRRRHPDGSQVAASQTA